MQIYNFFLVFYAFGSFFYKYKAKIFKEDYQKMH